MMTALVVGLLFLALVIWGGVAWLLNERWRNEQVRKGGRDAD
jgi:hypothetical protein